MREPIQFVDRKTGDPVGNPMPEDQKVLDSLMAALIRHSLCLADGGSCFLELYRDRKTHRLVGKIRGAEEVIRG